MLEGAASGNLCITDCWPGQMRTVYGDHERFVADLFLDLSRASTSPATAAAATRTAITGSPAASTTCSTSPATAWARRRSKSALVAHAKVAEAAVVGYPHDIKGQGIYCYVTLKAGERADRASCARSWSRMGPQGDRPDRLARPDPLRAGPAEDALGQDHAPHPAQDRRGRFRNLGDTSTLADPAVVDDLIANRQNRREPSVVEKIFLS